MGADWVSMSLENKLQSSDVVSYFESLVRRPKSEG